MKSKSLAFLPPAAHINPLLFYIEKHSPLQSPVRTLRQTVRDGRKDRPGEMGSHNCITGQARLCACPLVTLQTSVFLPLKRLNAMLKH